MAIKRRVRYLKCNCSNLMSVSNTIKRIPASIAVMAFLLATTSSHGMNLYTYDLDSLVYMGPQIVEGTLGTTFVTNNFTAWKFKISAVHGGGFKVGQSIDVTALGFYCVSKDSIFGNDPLKEGDQLFLFLARAVGDGLFYNIPQNAEIYWPAPSGVRFVSGEKAYGFLQYMNPGPYVAVLDGWGTNSATPTVAQLREQIRASVPRIEKWKPLLERKATSNDVSALLQILRGRRDRIGMGEDLITEKVCRSLHDLQDFDAMFEAAHVVGDQQDLSEGFATAAGHRFLLTKSANANESVEDRVLSANLLSSAGEGTADEWHLKHIVELAALPKQNEKLQVALLDSIHQMARWFQFAGGTTNADSRILEDRKQAGTILTRLAGETDSEEVKYEIDLVLPALGFSPLSSRNCLLQLDHFDPPTRRLFMRCHISGAAGMNPVPIAFVDVKTAQKWTALSTLYFHGDETESPSDVVVPNDLPHGRYKVFYEFMEDGKVTSTSHFFEVDL